MPARNRTIRKVLVCELCLFFPKSKNTLKRKHTHTQTNQKWGKVLTATAEKPEAGISGTGISVTGAWKFQPMTRLLKAASFRLES